MKKIFFICIAFLLIGFTNVNAQKQHIKIYPIPSYCILCIGTNVFQEKSSTGGITKEKRDINVSVGAGGTHGPQGCGVTGCATVWIVKGNGTIILGPFIVQFGEILTVPIDGGQWGAVVQTEQPVYISVWIDKSSPWFGQ